jgi:peptide/nickel transport system substrate-binding protein
VNRNSEQGQPGDEVREALDAYLGGGLSRRAFLQRTGLLGLGAIASASLLAACTPSSSNPSSVGSGKGTSAGKPKTGGTFKEGYDRDFTPPDPVANAWADPTFNAFWEGLAIRDPSGTLVPMLADSFKSSATGWTFELKNGLKFHNGVACTADIVAKDFNIYAGKVKNITAQNGIFWTPITEITSSGQTVTCTTKQPFQAFQETVGTEYSYIIDPDARNKAGKDWGSKVVVGTGPFTLGEYVPGQRVTAKNWADYPGSNVPFFANKGKAYLDEVQWVPITQGSQRAPEITTGSVDAVKNVPPQDIASLKDNSDLVVQEFQELSNFFLFLNPAKTQYGFDNVAVRQAISMAIDRKAIVQAIFLGHAKPTFGPYMPGYKWYDSGVEKFNQFDTDKAGSLLDGAGWTKGSDGTRAKDGNKLAFEVFNLTDEVENQVLQAMSQMLSKVGVKMTVTSLADTAFYPKLNKDTAAFGFKWLWSSPIDVVQIFGTAYSPAKYETTTKLNDLYTTFQTVGSPDELAAAAKAYSVYFAENLPYVPIYTPNTIWVNHKKVVGWSPNQVNLYPFYNDVWLAG